jgi:outer membrane protein assembly factor BamB
MIDEGTTNSLTQWRSAPMPFLRTVFLVLAVCVAAKSATAAEPSKGAVEKDWPVFRGNQQSTAAVSAALPESLEVLWQFRPEGKNRGFDATPVVLNGTVYISDLGNFDGRVYALDLATGDRRWQFTTDSDFVAAAAVRDDRVFVGDIDGRFYCLNAKTGTALWKFEADGEIDSGANFYQDKILFGSQDGTLYCLNKDGKLVWKYSIDNQIRCTPTVVADRAFVAGCDGKLHIVDLTSGEAAATVEIMAPTGMTPGVKGDQVFFGTEDSVFFCVNWRQAKIVWTYQDESRRQSLRSPPAIVDGFVVYGGQSKRVYAVDPRDGALRWKFTARQRVDAGPVISGSRVYVAAVDGRLYALDLKSGKELWQFEAAGGFVGSPAVAENRLVIASDEGVVYCFGSNKN